jgi:hypothetical protein
MTGARVIINPDNVTMIQEIAADTRFVTIHTIDGKSIQVELVFSSLVGYLNALDLSE